MFCKKFIFLFIYLSASLCLCDTDDDTAAVTPKLYFVGGQTAQNVDDPKYTELAEKSLQKYLETTGNTESYNEIKIKNVTSQVVAGIKTTMYFIVSPTGSDGDTLRCKSIILEQAWKNLTDIDVTCQIENQSCRKKRETPIFAANSERMKDQNDPYYQELAAQALEKYLQSENETRPHKIISIIGATRNVANGAENTNIAFDVAPETKEEGRDLICYSNIEDVEIQDHTDPKYMDIAKKSLEYLVESNGMPPDSKIIRMEKVTSQADGENITKIRFIVSSEQERLDYNCITEISENNGIIADYDEISCEEISVN